MLKPITKSLKTFLSWNVPEIGYKTDDAGAVTLIYCKICAKHKDKITGTNATNSRGVASQSTDAFINGTNVVTKTQVRLHNI